MHSFYLNAIKSFEGYTPAAAWDYAQLSNGYGTRAQYAGEVVDRAEAERRFQSEISSARSIVEKAAPEVDEGTKAALTSLTYNAGDAWVKSGLGDAVRRGDLDQAREIFQQYNKAGGEVLPGLVSRRAAEAMWIGNPNATATGVSAGAALAQVSASEPAGPMPAVLSSLPRPVVASTAVASRPIAATTDMSQRSDAATMSNETALSTLKRLSGDGLATLSALEGGRSSEAPLAGSHLTELARMVRLDNSHALFKSRDDRGQESERA